MQSKFSKIDLKNVKVVGGGAPGAPALDPPLVLMVFIKKKKQMFKNFC